MAQQTIGLGAVPEDGSGDGLREGGAKINANFTELYVNINKAVTVGTSNRDTTSTTYADTGDSVSLLPKSTTSKLKITLSCGVRLLAGQDGIQFQWNYSLDNGSTFETPIEFALFIMDAIASNNFYSPITKSIVINSPAINDTVVFDLQFKTKTAASTGRIEGGRQIILEIEEFEV